MDTSKIKSIISVRIPLTKQEGDTEKKRTVKDTFHVGKLSGNRLNSGTIRSQFIICEKESDWNHSDDAAKKALHSDQRVFVQVDDDVWNVYKGSSMLENDVPVKIYDRVSNLDELISKERQFLVKEYGGKQITQTSLSAQNFNDLTISGISIYNTIRTKPFMLIAGISGTGKSRIVKEMAFQSCPNISSLRVDKVSPGNYCLIEVKPNWHDSTELLGYDSVINKGYVVTKFVKFLVKAMCYPEVPFFVCLDEMNLAPVEQYFAEFLSVLESRKKDDDKEIKSEALIDASIFKNQESKLFNELFDIKLEQSSSYDSNILVEDHIHYGKESNVYALLKEEGLRIPKNLIVIGTVNMDETTHQFSRKVIDRAMTIEMNIEDGETPFNEFFESDGELTYYEKPLDSARLLPTNVTAKQAMEDLNAVEQIQLKDEVPSVLAAINEALNGTPFKIAYRVQNELLVYFGELRRFDKETGTTALLNKAVDGILMMKVLPRIEGDKDLLGKPLAKLASIANEKYPEAAKKIAEMKARLELTPFTSFWP